MQYGLKIYNANIAEMADQDEKTRYFQNLRQKALEGANTEMRIQVSKQSLVSFSARLFRSKFNSGPPLVSEAFHRTIQANDA